jgi:hypothetical protein
MVVLEAPTFDGRLDPWTLINWLGEMDQFFDQIGLLEAMKVRFAKMKLRSRARDFWYSIENHRIRRGKPIITDWNEMKQILIEKYVPQSYQEKYLYQSSVKRENRFATDYVSQFEKDKRSVRAAMEAIRKDIHEGLKDLSEKIKLFVSLYQKKIHSNETKDSHLEDNGMGNEILEIKELQAPLEPSAENKLQVRIDEPKLCMEDLTEHVIESLLDEEKVQQESQELDAPATLQDKAVTLATLTPHIDFIIPKTLTRVMEHMPSFFLGLPKVLTELVQVPSTRVLILEHFKTRGRVFSNQGSMMREDNQEFFRIYYFKFYCYLFICYLVFKILSKLFR